jgi:hypothetical protein
VIETDHFINFGYGWICKRCQAINETRAGEAGARSRFLAEAEDPTHSTAILARWSDASRQTLFCPRCVIEERVNKA